MILVPRIRASDRMMTASATGDDYDDDASLQSLQDLTGLTIELQGFIVDIDDIQAHGMYGACRSLSDDLRFVGVGAADITKLKANGYHTVAVSAASCSYAIVNGATADPLFQNSQCTLQPERHFSRSRASAKSRLRRSRRLSKSYRYSRS